MTDLDTLKMPDDWEKQVETEAIRAETAVEAMALRQAQDVDRVIRFCEGLFKSCYEGEK